MGVCHPCARVQWGPQTSACCSRRGCWTPRISQPGQRSSVLQVPTGAPRTGGLGTACDAPQLGATSVTRSSRTSHEHPCVVILLCRGGFVLAVPWCVFGCWCLTMLTFIWLILTFITASKHPARGSCWGSRKRALLEKPPEPKLGLVVTAQPQADRKCN